MVDKKQRNRWTKTASPKDPSDVLEYIYISEYESDWFLSDDIREMGPRFVRKLAWDDMPPLLDVKAVMETEGRVALFLEGEKFVYFEKEGSIV
jgi:hypothetical protein